MCGIAGFCDFNKKSDKEILVNMTDVLHHRGPDDSGYSFYENEYAQIGLGHRRLSIIDLSSLAHQPMAFEHLEIVYNGEVYNFAEIKKELESYCYTFLSHSDTEVILKAYHKWGINAVHKFNGMFAIAIYDKKEQKLVLIRDRAGVKPLYYYYSNGLFLFASELKSFHKHPFYNKELDINSLSLYFQFCYIPSPYTIFHNTHKLCAGSYLELDLTRRQYVVNEYWNVIDCYNLPKLSISENEAIDLLDNLFKSAFEYRMKSDVPVGVFLSGGYDSTLVTAILQSTRTTKLNTFTIGFNEDSFNEAPFAKEIAKYLGTNHIEYYCTPKDALDILPELPIIFDEPFGDSSAIPTTLVSKLAREHVTVSLSADGGDETFAGYDKYVTTFNLFKKIRDIPLVLKKVAALLMDEIDPRKIPFFKDTYNFATRYEKIKKIILSKNILEVLKFTSEYFSLIERKTLLKNIIKEPNTYFDSNFLSDIDEVSKILAIDYKTYLVDDILTKVDRATMSVSLEGREPLLDYRIIEFVSKLPSAMKYKKNEKKWILKQLTYKYIPKELMDRPKKGFAVPLTVWFKDQLKEYLLHYLDRNKIQKEGILNSNSIVELRDRYLSGHNENVNKLWLLLMFEMWYEKWL